MIKLYPESSKGKAMLIAMGLRVVVDKKLVLVCACEIISANSQIDLLNERRTTNASSKRHGFEFP